MNVLIVGNGIAATEVAFNLRSNPAGKNIKITLFSRENCMGYDPSTLPYLISGKLHRNAVFLKRSELYDRNKIKVMLDSEVVSINTRENSLTTKKGDIFTYDKLVLAYGGSTFIPPINGIDKSGVFTVKTLGQANTLQRHKGNKAVIIGSGAIGIEVAEALHIKGYKVTIVELLNWILPTLFCEPTARKLEKNLKENGIEVYTGERILSIEGKDRVESVVTNKKNIACDTVINTAGIFIDKTFLPPEIETNRGIKVDKSMKTNIDNIYACGDCAETYNAITGEDCLIQLKHNAINQARIVAKNILSRGKSYHYEGSYSFARINFFSTHAVTFGHTLASATKLFGKDSIEILERDQRNGYLRLILREEEIIGGQAFGETANYIGLFMGLMWRKDRIYNLRKNRKNIVNINSNYPWTYRKIDQIINSEKLISENIFSKI